MIYLFSGTPGAGKSLNLARTIRLWLHKNRTVISSMYIDVRLCFLNIISRFVFEISRGKLLIFDSDDKRANNYIYKNIYEITPDYLIQYAIENHIPAKEHQSLVVLDECISIFSPEKCQGQYWLDWQRFFQYHRHLGYDVILVPQNTQLLARKVQHFAEYEVRHRAMKNANFVMAIISLLLGGLFTTKTYWQGSSNKKHIDKEWFRYHYYLGKMYNSYCMFDELAEQYHQEQNKKAELKLTFKQKKIVELCTLLQGRINQLGGG